MTYTGSRPPKKLGSEVYTKRDPIRLVLRKGSDVANKKRVINMGMEIPIKYGLKVDFRGDVHGGSMQKLLAYRNEIRYRGNMKNQAEWGPLGPARYHPVTKTYS